MRVPFFMSGVITDYFPCLPRRPTAAGRLATEGSQPAIEAESLCKATPAVAGSAKAGLPPAPATPVTRADHIGRRTPPVPAPPP